VTDRDSPLRGGYINAVVRAGDTVRRQVREPRPFVHDLLRRLDEPDDRAALVDTILWWQDRCWRGIQAEIDAGTEAVRGLAEAGAVAAVLADFEWTRRHRGTLEAGLR